MKTIDLHQVDAFTDEVFGGNPAAVVPQADDLADEQMQQIAREMNLSETAFVSKSTMPDADFRLRWFTPSAEVDFCGHATIGTLFELARLKLYGLGKDGESQVRVETLSGVLDMWSTVKDSVIAATFTSPVPNMEQYRLQGEAFATALGIGAEALHPEAEILLNTAQNDLFIPVKSSEVLGALEFDFSHIREQFASEHIVVFGLYTPDGSDSLQVRGLAPLVGVDEDPFTGRLQAALLRAAWHNGFVDKSQNEITTRQGQFMGRPGFARVRFDSTSDATKVTGRAAHVFSTEVELSKYPQR